MPDNTELELVARLKAGDLSVFNMLTRMWYGKIYGFLYRMLGDVDEAEDVCQTTFITAYSRLHQLNDKDRFSPWLYRIANNHAIDQLRTRKRLNSVNVKIGFDGSDLPGCESADIESKIDRSALHHLFEKVMLSIPEEQRAVVVMKLYQDLKFTEIAGILKVPVNTVKTRMYSGLRAIKEALGKNKLIEEILRNAM